MQTLKSFTEIKCSVEDRAQAYATELLRRVTRGLLFPKVSGSICSRQELFNAAALTKRGEHIVKQQPEFRAALWLL